MKHTRKNTDSIFPSPDTADENGFVAFSADLNGQMLKDAYLHGIFPWPFDDSGLIPWQAPLMRGILPMDKFHIPNSLRREMKKFPFHLKVDSVFEEVIRACAAAARPNQDGTWITEKIISAYLEFHQMGYAHSFETFDEGDNLVGGLYGISLGRVFCGESMFYKISGASKFAFVKMVEFLKEKEVVLIDTQMVTSATESFGAYEVPSAQYISLLNRYKGHPLDFSGACLSHHILEQKEEK